MQRQPLLSVLYELVLCASSLLPLSDALSITSGNCYKNVSVKYQVPVTRTRYTPSPSLPSYDYNNNNNELYAYSTSGSSSNAGEQYVDYEERTRWDTVRICCSGYRAIIFGFCAPICTQPCPPLSYCAAPDRCACLYGYTASHLTSKRQQLICRPTCQGGCPQHSYCAAHNQCKCRPGYKDVSRWFHSVHCERVRCPAQWRYDVARSTCVPHALDIEEMILQVADKLAQGETSGLASASESAARERDAHTTKGTAAV